jgi:hypothetical protein
MGQSFGFGEQKNLLPAIWSRTDLARFWVIVSITLSIIGIMYLSMAAGYGSVVPQLFYFPILYTTYFYPGRGIWVAGCCTAAYLIVAAPFLPLDPVVLGGVVLQALLFIGIGVGSAWVLKHRTACAAPGPGDDSSAVRAMIATGESDRIEFKKLSLWSADLTKEECLASESAEVRKFRSNASKFIIARSIAGFLNTAGGDLIIGIEEDRVHSTTGVAGIDGDYPRMHEKDRNPDGYRRMLIDSVIRKYIPGVYDTASRFIHISFPVVSGKTVCRLHIEPVNEPVFVDTGNEELFFIRVDASTRSISGKTLTHYILNRFSSS